MRWMIFLVMLCWHIASQAQSVDDTEVIVLAGFEETKAWLDSEGWWGENEHEEHLTAPNVLITGITSRWRETAPSLPVSDKKEAFYRFLLPLVLHANEMVLRRRDELLRVEAWLESGKEMDAPSLARLQEFAPVLRVRSREAAAEIPPSGGETEAVVQEMLHKLDIIPPGLALGQAAYESGYGTSRFAAEGNALFGQWTFGGKGLVPEQQRESLGDHRIAAYDWPFDSVRGYFINLMSHPAYEPFRELRRELRAAGEPLTSIALADGLISYSERGQVYVDTLKGIIRVNNLEIADTAVLRDEPRRFLVGAEDAADADRIRAEIEAARQSGELADIIERMDLD